MKVLVTGGTGVVGKAAVDRLIARGHEVRLLSRHADRDALQWPRGCEARCGDVGEDEGVAGAAAGCDVVLHVTGIVSEHPPEVTFERINVQGTRRVLREARRAAVKRFIYVSSLGADTGASPYHRSKKAGEEIVRTEAGELPWLICRPANVYGSGDEVLGLILRMVRSLPVVPLVGNGNQPFQPVWADDVGEALARAVEMDSLVGLVLELAGPEVTSMNVVLDLLGEITGRKPARLPVPEAVARLGTSAADLLGLDLPVHADQITMLTEGNHLAGRTNAMIDPLAVPLTPLRDGLAKLACSQPEQLPGHGVGALRFQRYWADVGGADAASLFADFRARFAEIVPEGLLDATAEGTRPVLTPGATLTMAIPLRGHIQVRVEEATATSITCVTLAGHPLAGAIRFLAEDVEGGARFEVRSYARAADATNAVAMRTFGQAAQRATWKAVVAEMVRRGDGEPEVSHAECVLGDEEAKHAEEWIEGVVMARKRAAAPPQTTSSG